MCNYLVDYDSDDDDDDDDDDEKCASKYHNMHQLPSPKFQCPYLMTRNM